MTQTTDQGVLRELADKEAIRDLARYYAHFVWQRDVPAIAELFTEDAQVDTPELPTISGRQAILESYQKMLGTDEFHPFVHNHVVELDGDVATGTCYLDLRATIDGKELISSGVYDDRYERVDGTWKFAYRKVTMFTFASLRKQSSGQPPRS